MRTNKEYWRLMANGVQHSDGFTFDEANDIMKQHEGFFPDVDYYIEPDPNFISRMDRGTYTYNNNACDGWEDIYPLEED